jgi:tetratricopeptide (TPR) repeat protein
MMKNNNEEFVKELDVIVQDVCKQLIDKLNVDKEIAIINAEEEKRRKYESAIQKGDIDFTDGNFNEAKKKYLIALKVDETVEVKTKIENCEKGICNQYISKGDSLYLKELYDQALLIYSKSKTCLKYKEIEDKIKITEQKIIETKINKIKNIADSFVNIQKYDLALELSSFSFLIKLSYSLSKLETE